ncbi:DUF2809 domain-containing protein [Algoriphagus sp. NG3]|uniref:ribosomal maturation YjgA family protein n=1 Tax=Algoriphagus sp. NG3 TaxID=3097546 RepID=UPI002A8218F9|nr:DUF2809 domain-containing protein [Algoriphagus sp. NG3]WPR73916.1 DUF2809 domain-containing protein [Algoriphagus sp. NG3]
MTNKGQGNSARQKYLYACIILIIIALGLLSRKTTFLPAAIGDALYASMMYFIVRFFLVNHKVQKVAIFGLAICFAIELSQLYQAPWINEIRTTLPGRLMLGQGFLWTDLLAYVVGIVLAASLDMIMKRK